MKLFQKIRRKYINKYIISQSNKLCDLLIDSTVIYNKGGINKIGRNKFYKNKKATKISLMTDVNGFPLSILFMKGNYHDNCVFNQHIRDALVLVPNKTNHKKSIRIMADKAYSSKENYTLLESNNMGHIIPPRKNMQLAQTYKYDKKEYSQRIKIEHIFSRIKAYKRINMRYDKIFSHFREFVLLGFIFVANHIINKM